jgi:L,D-transpeptidase catalytic domain
MVMTLSRNDGAARSASVASATVRMRAALTAGTALAILLAPLAGAEARPVAHPGREHAKKEAPKTLQVPLIAVSIADQRLTLYDKGEVVAHAPVSTGMPGHPTPTGVFSVLGKEVFHRSNIYSGAPMPYMQRITWSGVALHAGVLPGYPASHGCIRMPPEFAIRLFHLTQRGARVIVSHGEVTPVRFENPHLFTLLRPADTRTGEAAPPPAADAPAVKTAETRTPAVMSDAADSAAHAIAGIAKPGETAVTAPPKDAPRDAAKDAAPQDVAHADAAKGQDAAKSGAPGAALVKPVTVVPPQPITVNKAFVPIAPTIEAAPPSGTQASLEPYGPERPLRRGPITVFVSKKEGKIFIRKGFEQLLAEPITIAHPELALGTHLFTAVAPKADGASFDWVAVTIPTTVASKPEVKIVRDHRGRLVEKMVAPAAPSSATAAQALDRIEIPPDAMARIASLMSPGATLIISDQGLGSETGPDDTDFIVLTR